MYIEGLDEFDNKIIEILKGAARLSYSEIGERIGISRVSVKNRMDSLESRGIIKGYTAIIDESKATFGIKFFLDLECFQPDFESVLKMLSGVSFIRQIYVLSGNSRIHATGYVTKSQELYTLIDRLYRRDSGVRRLDCHTVLSTIKDVDGGVDYEPIKNNEETTE